MRILIVDDNPLDRELLRVKLEEASHSVEEAADGMEALGILGNKKVDAVISDVLMPTMDGYRLCMEVRSDTRLRPVPFLFYTGTYVGREDQAFGNHVGADRYLLKSPQGDGVLEALDELTRDAQARNNNHIAAPEETAVLKEYNQVLVAKLEKRNIELTVALADRRRLEDQIREAGMRAEEQIGRFFETGINLHCVAGFDGFFKRLNSVWEELTGFTREELMRVPFMDFIHPDDIEGTRGELEKLGAGAKTVGYEVRLRCKDGSYRWTQWSAVPVPEQVVILATGRDITAQKAAEAARRESDARLQAFMDNSTSLIFIKDFQGRYLHINREFERSFGMSAAEVLGHDDRELFPPSQARGFRMNDRKVLRTGKPIQTEETAHYRGVAHVSLVSKFPMFDDSGRINALCGIATDITDRKRAEEDLRRVTTRLLQMQDTERRRLGHELHDSTAQSLAALEIHLSALKKLTRNSPVRKRELVKDCLALAGQSAREIRTIAYALRPPLLDEMGLVAALQSHVRSFAKRSGLKCRLLVSRDFERPRPDAEIALFRIVQEALANAHRHSGTDSVIVRLRRDQRKIVLEISDHGHGMPASSIDTYLASKASPGVGLAGMRERARQLGGDLDIHSSPRGTRVRAEVPLRIS